MSQELLMFTGCIATCPIQGALLAQAQRDMISAKLAAQFVSLSIDPLSDTPAALDGGLRKFQAQPGWLSVAPRVEDVAAITAWLTRGKGQACRFARPAHRSGLRDRRAR